MCIRDSRAPKSRARARSASHTALNFDRARTESARAWVSPTLPHPTSPVRTPSLIRSPPGGRGPVFACRSVLGGDQFADDHDQVLGRKAVLGEELIGQAGLAEDILHADPPERDADGALSESLRHRRPQPADDAVLLEGNEGAGACRRFEDRPAVERLDRMNVQHLRLDALACQLIRGIEAEVLNVHTIKPLDRRTILESAARTGALVTFEEHSVIGGLGSAVAEALAESSIRVPFRRIGVQDVFGETGLADELLAKHGLTAENLVVIVRELVAAKDGATGEDRPTAARR